MNWPIFLRVGVPAGALLVSLGACAPPKVMIHDSFLPGTEKVARESVKQVSGGDSKTTLSNYYIQVCDVQGSRQSQCKTTLVLENITNYTFRGILE